MKYKLIILTILIGMNSCNLPTNPDKRSVMTIQEKSLVNSDEIGRYKYTIKITNSDNKTIYFYSDSNWDVGDTIKLTKQP